MVLERNPNFRGEAAVAAARGVRGLPEGDDREVLLPVRFRLD
jgi:hypothetical protein